MALTATTLRPMELGDIDRVLELERGIFPAPWTEAMVREELAAPGRSYLVVEDQGLVVGYGGVMIVEGDAHIMNLAVAPGSRRKGVATMLMLQLVDEALERGAAHLTLELRVSNAGARALYEKFGFATVGVRPRYYRDEDALIMWALDVDGAAYRERLQAIRGEVA